jgi:hypothetical protein
MRFANPAGSALGLALAFCAGKAFAQEPVPALQDLTDAKGDSTLR